MLLSLTVFQQSVSEAMPITSLQIPLLGNFVVYSFITNKGDRQINYNHLIVRHSRQNLFLSSIAFVDSPKNENIYLKATTFQMN